MISVSDFQNNPIYDQLCGGGALYPEFQSLGINSDLKTFVGDGHCPWDSDGDKKAEMIEFVSGFIYDNLDCSNSVSLNKMNATKKVLITKDILGRISNSNSSKLLLHLYDDGSVKKEYRVF